MLVNERACLWKYISNVFCLHLFCEQQTNLKLIFFSKKKINISILPELIEVAYTSIYQICLCVCMFVMFLRF